MNYLQLVSAAAGLISAKMTGRRVPLQVHIGVTKQCNRNCSYCEASSSDRSRKSPSTKQLLDIIDGCARLGTKRVTLLGGEPLLHENIDEIVARVKHNGISCSLTTNGRFSKRHLKTIRKLDQLSVSIDGDKATHDAHRGDGSWEDAMTAIALAGENNIPVQLLVTVTKLADYKLSYITELADRYDCYIDFNFLSPVDDEAGLRLRPEAASGEQMRKLLDYFLKKPNPRVVYSSYVLRYLREWPFPESSVRLSDDQIPAGFKPIRCRGGHFSAYLDADGNLWPCSLPRSDYKANNAFDVGIEAAWEKMPENICVACRYTGYCMMGALYAFHPGTMVHLLKLILKGKYT